MHAHTMGFPYRPHPQRYQPETTYAQRPWGDLSRRFGTQNRDPITGDLRPGEHNQYGQAMGSTDPGAQGHDWSAFDRAFGSRPSDVFSQAAQGGLAARATQAVTGGSTTQSPTTAGTFPSPSGGPYVSPGGYGMAIDVPNHGRVQYNDFNGVMEVKHPGWGQMTPEQRGNIVRNEHGLPEVHDAHPAIVGGNAQGPIRGMAINTPYGTAYSKAPGTATGPSYVGDTAPSPDRSRGTQPSMIAQTPQRPTVTPDQSNVDSGSAPGFTPPQFPKPNINPATHINPITPQDESYGRSSSALPGAFASAPMTRVPVTPPAYAQGPHPYVDTHDPSQAMGMSLKDQFSTMSDRVPGVKYGPYTGDATVQGGSTFPRPTPPVYSGVGDALAHGDLSGVNEIAQNAARSWRQGVAKFISDKTRGTPFQGSAADVALQGIANPAMNPTPSVAKFPSPNKPARPVQDDNS